MTGTDQPAAGPDQGPGRSVATLAIVGPHLDGMALARALTAALGDAGFDCERPGDLGGPVSITMRLGRREFSLLLGELGEERRWLVSTSSGVMPLMAVLGDKADRQHRLLVATVHDALVALPAVDDIRWYTAEDWKQGRTDNWAATPLG